MPGQAKILSQKEITDVLKLLESPRDRALFGIGIYTGMRISEVISLQQDQAFTADGGIRYQIVIKRLKKKNTMYSDIPVHPKLRTLLKDYQKVLRDDHFLFPSSESISGHISRARAHQILSAAFSSLKLTDAKTHSMRRSFLTCMSRAGIPLRTIQTLSGHSNLGQLQAYLEVDEGDKHRAVNSLKY